MNKLLVVILFLVPFALFGQDKWDEIPVVGVVSENDTVDANLYDSPELSEGYFKRTIRLIDPEYTGYVIELVASNHELAADHPVFTGFGRIFKDQVDNDFHYLYLVDLRKRKSVKQYFQKVVKPKASNAKVVQYLNGVRTKVFSW